jgi:glycosyltransferase involved in cell wall biosynthesis
MRFSVVTPCYNAERYIEQTMRSVLAQSAVLTKKIELEYIIIDGASKDRTVSIVERYANSSVHFVSEPDTGMYDALAKGLRRATGDIVSYINAGDIYFPWAFDVLHDLAALPDWHWITGYSCNFNDQLQAVGVALPYKYRSRLIDCGMYGRELPFIQQESTFWRARVQADLDLERLKTFKRAGDYFLWHQFAKSYELTIVSALLGGFRIHPGQISEDKLAYMAEVSSFARKPSLFETCHAFCDKLMWYTPRSVKKNFNPRRLFVFDHAQNKWI